MVDAAGEERLDGEKSFKKSLFRSKKNRFRKMVQSAKHSSNMNMFLVSLSLLKIFFSVEKTSVQKNGLKCETFVKNEYFVGFSLFTL